MPTLKFIKQSCVAQSYLDPGHVFGQVDIEALCHAKQQKLLNSSPRKMTNCLSCSQDILDLAKGG